MMTEEEAGRKMSDEAVKAVFDTKWGYICLMIVVLAVSTCTAHRDHLVTQERLAKLECAGSPS